VKHERPTGDSALLVMGGRIVELDPVQTIDLMYALCIARAVTLDLPYPRGGPHGTVAMTRGLLPYPHGGPHG
jgi:hypothetical protein